MNSKDSNYRCILFCSSKIIKRRYFKSIKKFKKEQLENGYFTKFEYLKSIVPHAIVCYMPNGLRDFIYKKLLRKGKPNERKK